MTRASDSSAEESDLSHSGPGVHFGKRSAQISSEAQFSLYLFPSVRLSESSK